MSTPLFRARTFLFVSALRCDRLAKALASGAGCVVMDLEDAVPPLRKASAREALALALAGLDRVQLSRVLVRLNAAGTPWHGDDLRQLRVWAGQGLAGVIVPKAEAPETLREVARAAGPGVALVPLIESLLGWDRLDPLARVPGVARLAFGHIDFQADLAMQCEEPQAELLPVRLALVAASRRAGLAAPIDGITDALDDPARVFADARRARALGFLGKLCIHPAQLPMAEQALSPSPGELDWARRVSEAAAARGGEAFQLDGRMVDLPVLRLAERLLQQAAG